MVWHSVAEFGDTSTVHAARRRLYMIIVKQPLVRNWKPLACMMNSFSWKSSFLSMRQR